jgi:hypothetical protein
MQKTSIKRLYEADDIQQPAPLMQAPVVQQPPQAMPTEAPIAEIPSFDQFQNQEQPQAALPQPDVMSLSVQELMDRCQQVNPLICMGLQQFIDANKDQILSIPSGAENQEVSDEPGEEDINFSKQMEPQAPEFSLDNQEGLEFPQE